MLKPQSGVYLGAKFTLRSSPGKLRKTYALRMLSSFLIFLAASCTAGKFDESIPAKDKGVVDSTGEIGEILQITSYASNQNRGEETFRFLKQALEKHPDNFDLLLKMGIVLRKSKEYAKAEIVYQKLLSLNPESAEVINNRSVNLLFSGYSPEAIATLRNLTARHPTYPEPFFNLGVAYEKSGKILPAIDAYQQYLNLIPDSGSRLESALAREKVQELQGLL